MYRLDINVPRITCMYCIYRQRYPKQNARQYGIVHNEGETCPIVLDHKFVLDYVS